jgi:NhaP-type Na+/H+ or K+/H+ antiporter
MNISCGTSLALPPYVTFEFWCAIAGLLLLGMALIPNRIEKWPITSSMVYLGVGLLLGPLALNKIRLTPLEHSELLERLAEIAVIISLFSAGLKLRLPLNDRRWLVPLRLSFLSMMLTVLLVTLVGVYLLKLPLGAAVLLGGILAPTDPVLASDVQVKHSKDDDRLRFSLTGEAGLNDGTSFPFVMFGLGLLGLHELGENNWKWLTLDVIWPIIGGLAIGATLGTLVARLVVWLRSKKKEAVGSDDFLALGLITGAYGVALLCHTYGFLAVFAAGVALRRSERLLSDGMPNDRAENESKDKEDKKIPLPQDDQEVDHLREKLATHPDHAAGIMARQILRFDEALERIAELGLVVLLGAMLTKATWTNDALWLAPLLFLVIRPLSTSLGLWGTRNTDCAKPYVAWFGIRGIGSLYYLFYAAEHGLSPQLAERLVAITFSVVAISVVVHGLSVTPLMKIYEKGGEKS